MNDWTGWPLERLLYLFLGLAYTLLWMQLTMLHWHGGFHNKIMWGPVIGTPFIAIIAFVMTFVHGGFVDTTFVVLFAAGVLEGIVGTVMHLRGVASQVGGMTLRNMISGPSDSPAPPGRRDIWFGVAQVKQQHERQSGWESLWGTIIMDETSGSTFPTEASAAPTISSAGTR